MDNSTCTKSGGALTEEVDRPQSSIHWLSDADIVPDEIQNELIQIGDFLTEGAFRIGDIANDLIVRVAETGWQVTNDRVYAAVGRFCGKSGRTVRYYSETSGFYPNDVRQEFHTAPFSHFVFARGLGCRWREALEHSAVTPGATVTELMRQFTMIAMLKEGEVSQDIGESGLMKKTEAAIEASCRETCETSQNSNGNSPGRVVGDLVCALDRALDVLSKIELDKKDDLSRLLEESVRGCADLREVLSELSETWYATKNY